MEPGGVEQMSVETMLESMIPQTMDGHTVRVAAQLTFRLVTTTIRLLWTMATSVARMLSVAATVLIIAETW